MICKTTNEYFQYLFGSWDCLHTMSTWQSQTPQELTYAIVPRRLYSTRSFRSTGLSFRQILQKFGWRPDMSSRSILLRFQQYSI